MGCTLSDEILIMESLLWSYKSYIFSTLKLRVPFIKGNLDIFKTTIP
jgi:hypothetical protein